MPNRDVYQQIIYHKLWISFFLSLYVVILQKFKDRENKSGSFIHKLCRYFFYALPSNHFDLSFSYLCRLLLTCNQFYNLSLSEIIKLRITYKITPSIFLKRPSFPTPFILDINFLSLIISVQTLFLP